MKTLPLVLREARITKGIVIRSLAQVCGLDPALISKFEKGHRIPNEENLEALAAALDLSFDQLRRIWLSEKVYQILADEEDEIGRAHV